ncbi:polymer-forming cytoskeletal protein [Saliphagus infecundisoli]|uniref:Polymer-forming cytoskeletal protein n=1 Tax=Saliphagus infecundisoli TaxID=1849069 RepID=A0ABD5QFI8_9EURY|nr:polymer-forming cytoskeletal protein [Saliphagus infecundisoli]
MAFSREQLEELRIPDGTRARERTLSTDGDAIVGARSTIDLGLRAGDVLAGEGVEFGGDLEAEGDCRLDMWCEVAENVLVGGDAYVGERTHIEGELRVAGDLDIGDDVDVEEGFEANGWIVIRNPMPTMVFLFAYLKHLFVVGEEDTANTLLSRLAGGESGPDDDDGDDGNGEGSEDEGGESAADTDAGNDGEDGGKADGGSDPLVVPGGASISDTAWRVSAPATIGDDCRLHGNVRAESIAVGEGNDVFGSLRARGDVTVGEGTTIHGDLTTKDGSVTLGPESRVLGDVSCTDLELGPGAEVDGTMRAGGEITMATGDRPDE